MSATHRLPADVERLIADCIDSVAALEVLLLLHRRAPARLDLDAVCRELGLDARWARTSLADLVDHGLLAHDATAGTWAFAPNAPTAAVTVAALARAYAERRVTVVNRIYDTPSRFLRVFADAFRLRKDR